MRPVLLFDVNETLLDLRILDAPFERLFGDSAARSAWFAQMLQLAFVGTITSEYVDFTTAQHAAIRMLAERRRVQLTSADADEVVALMSRLPPHDDVRPALERLKSHGFMLATLTNSVSAVAEAQLANAGIRDLLDRALSADAIGRLKPAPEPYQMAAAAFAVQPAEACLIASHAWDISGALAAGCQAAFVARPGAALSPIGRQPAIAGRDLGELAEILIQRWP